MRKHMCPSKLKPRFFFILQGFKTNNTSRVCDTYTPARKTEKKRARFSSEVAHSGNRCWSAWLGLWAQLETRCWVSWPPPAADEPVYNMRTQRHHVSAFRLKFCTRCLCICIKVTNDLSVYLSVYPRYVYIVLKVEIGSSMGVWVAKLQTVCVLISTQDFK